MLILSFFLFLFPILSICIVQLSHQSWYCRWLFNADLVYRPAGLHHRHNCVSIGRIGSIQALSIYQADLAGQSTRWVYIPHPPISLSIPKVVNLNIFFSCHICCRLSFGGIGLARRGLGDCSVPVFMCLGRGFASAGNCFVLDIYGAAAQLSMTGLRGESEFLLCHKAGNLVSLQISLARGNRVIYRYK